MTMTTTNQRARRAEDDYFRRRDAELIEKARPAATPAVDTVTEGERRALADALGVHATKLIEPLHAAGFRPSNAALLDWMPAIDVAWVDAVDTVEREQLRRQIVSDPEAVEAGLPLIMGFLYVQPPPELMAAAREVLRHQLSAMDAASRRQRFDRILARCESVGRASGGLLGLAATSRDERRRIAAIRAGLAGADEPQKNAELPH